MKDNLKDLIEHTYNLEGIELIKITGTATETKINAIAEDKSVIVSGAFKTALPEFAGTFGMPNLSKLKTIIGFDEYNEAAKISVLTTLRGTATVPDFIHFETKDGDFVNDYRLMSEAVVTEKIKNAIFKEPPWTIQFEPTVAGILRLKKQSNANSEEPNFTTKTENGDLKIYFGNPSTHSGNFVFHTGVTGTLARQWMWPVKQFQAIMDLTGDKIIKISDSGAAEVTVDSGIAVYRYILPAQAK